MKQIRIMDRATRQESVETIYGAVFIHALYGTSLFSRIFSLLFLPLMARCAIFSNFYGWLQKRRSSRSKIKRFIHKFRVDTSEFLKPLELFSSFNDFFIRRLKPRPLASGNDVAILPADGRYLVFENIDTLPGIWVKGHKFSLEELLQDQQLAAAYRHAALVIARLAPPDYHRFHFPTNCKAGAPIPIPGPLYSVNPIALHTDIHILARNKRVITPCQTKNFGTILYIEIGATYVGTIHQTFIPEEHYAKGDEKGYFSFGGSCILLLFEPGRIQFDHDLLDTSQRQIEMLGRYGQSLGRALNPL
jgi:phosphatidylserine decarboxylase